MLPRFYAPDAHDNADTPLVTLPDEEAAHLVRVLRLRSGDEVRVFDGRGNEWRGEVAIAGRRRASVKLVQRLTPRPEPRILITLAIAVLKGDKMDAVVRDLVMAGAAEIQPLLTERAEMSAAAIVRGQRMERWRRIAIASAKQCGRAVVPLVRPPTSFAACIARDTIGTQLVFVEPDQRASTGAVYNVPRPETATFFVGPEGGWTGAELAVAHDANAQLVTLGGLTLRADAMPLVALTALRTVWKDL